MPADPERTSDRKVAIVAVHGVGNQAAGTTATAIADLLANLDQPGQPGGPLYTPFTGRDLRVPVRRLDVPAHVPTGQSFAERAETLRVRPDRAPIDVEFTRSLLVDYEVSGPEDTYETVVLGGTRQSAAEAPIHVDVYEMYWADLSRLTQSAWSVLADTYQLLFHLGSLGVHAVSAAQASEPAVGTSRLWSAWARAQRLSADAIALGAALANLVLVGLAILLVGSALIPQQSLSAVVLGALIVAVVAGRLAYRYRWSRPLWLVALTATALFAAWSFFRWGLLLLPPDNVGSRLLITELWLVTSVGLGLVVRLYDRYRPGAGIVGAIFGLTVSLRLLPLTWGAIGPMGAVLDAGALACVALGGSWILFFLTGWAAFLLGRWVVFSTWLAHRHTPSSALAERLDRVRRTDWTARLTAAIPAALFVLATTIFWGAAWQSTSAQIDGCVPGTAIVGAFEHLLVQDVSSPPKQDCDDIDPAQIVRSVINTAAAWGFGALMSLVALAGLVGLVALMPSTLDEIRPPKGACDGRRLGQWLDAGLRHCRLGGYLLWTGVLVVLPVGCLVVTLGSVIAPDRVQVWADLNTALLTVIVGALAPVAAGVMTFGRRLKAMAPGIRTVVDAALDVDNHLREHPRDSAPRARIAARYASVLRRLYTRGYEKIIIVSHSQGTAITTDLLRYITYESTGPDAALVDDTRARDACPLVLLTMGSPLRQLYGLRFPYLYGWARHQTTGACASGAALPDTAAPDPAALGLSRWGNLYRSGDYVGRSLWRPDGCEPLNAVTNAAIPQPWPLDLPWPQAVSTDAGQTRFELCLGAGAHTHYWDETAPGVALMLDQLIAAPAADLPRPAPTPGAAEEARARMAR